MNRYVTAALRKANGRIVSFRLNHGLYTKTALPKADIKELYKKWPYVNPSCVRNNLPYDTNDAVDISFCIPMYNVERYIGTLLNNIEAQCSDYTYEAILVDDGSTDKTVEIVRRFVDGRNNYHLFVQENAGISAARNKAIDEARGRYLTFVDSDDEITEYYIEKLMKAAIKQDADIVKGKYYLKRDGKLLPRGIANGYIWGGVLRRSLFKNVRFPVGYWFEDMINLFLLVPLASKVVVIEDYVVYHNDVEGSSSKIQSKGKDYKALEHLYLVMSLTEDYYALGLSDKGYLHKRLMTECSQLMVDRTSGLDEETREQVFLACSQLFSDNGVEPDSFSGIEKKFAEAILNKDYTAWKMAAAVN